MLPDRTLILLGFVVVVVLATIVARIWVRNRDRRREAAPADSLWNALEARPDGRPTIVAFSTPSCAVCKSAQAPALDALVVRLGPASVRVIQVNATERPQVAAAFGILTVPTTIVLANNGRVATTNNGFAPLDRLTRQVELAATG
jgi:thioredoxin-like negative regulator of GroEL